MRLLFVLSGLLIGQIAAASDPGQPYTRMSPDELAAQFAAGSAVQPTATTFRGKVLWAENALFPRFRGFAQSLLWRGKEFFTDGSFTNRFPGFTALPSRGCITDSWTDGTAAFVLEYPRNYPLFGNYRDELRNVAPGVWLGRAWDRKTGRPLAWFVLSETGRK